MKTFLLVIVLLVAFTLPAFAQYGSHHGQYWRDDSNDGDSYNNANYRGMNDSEEPPHHGPYRSIYNR
jgi:hypothetical protein